MKVVSTGSIYTIFDDDLKTYNTLPSGVFNVQFSKNKGYFLEKRADMDINEAKIYGNHESKAIKVLTAFKKFNRNLGVILSGAKGIGKSLFARVVSNMAVQNNIPVLIINQYMPGVSAYLNSIEQEVLVLFDEFDKTYGDVNAADGMAPPQTELLSLFDGMSVGKKLFIITCNETHKLNEYLLNRPGRFHYHFRFENPSPEEIREYLMDKLDECYYTEIDDVIAFSQKIDLNFDCLRAIAFELNNGESFKTAIQDLNIINQEAVSYDIKLHFTNGYVIDFNRVKFDLFSGDEKTVYYGKINEKDIIYKIRFNASNCIFDGDLLTNIVNADNLIIEYYKDAEYEDDELEIANAVKSMTVAHLSLQRIADKPIHYAV